MKQGIKEIARLAGVSIGTVDRVLHNRGRVSAQSIEQVQKAIKKIDYKPNLMARYLVNKKTTNIALLIPDPGKDEYWAQAGKGVEAALDTWQHSGIHIELFRFDLEQPSSFLKAAGKLLNKKNDGVIFVPIFYEEGISFLKKCVRSSLPVMMFNANLPEVKTLGFIGTDSYQSGMLAGELLRLSVPFPGKFAVLHFDEDLKNSPHMLDKEKGFRNFFLQENSPGKVITIVLNNAQHDYQDQLQQLLSDDQPDGIFVSTSKVYIIGRFFQNKNIRNVKLAGFDLITRNISLLQQGWINYLINQNPRRQAELSISALSNYLLNKIIPRETVLFPLEIITRFNLNSYLKSNFH
jgi:LacI family transcriptional regulator